ncbi:hypothetical protein BJ322DRAFT_1212444 [Thelephora terrestris]|uniref:F-box domain-containing protein n=1 Tax=Thelephora terrestris TaxID=56493 RepID=A0A9P6HAI0_9AGAM|nr:hypothetical protein BJ322DRAFT_1212444 [Thelephora terrestris]
MVDPHVMGDSYSERDPSLSQLFDAIERKLDEMLGAYSCSAGAPFDKQMDEIILRASGIWKKSGYLKNSFARINRFPRELLGHIPTFLENERDLINTTAVCRHWRTTLLATPYLWCNISGSSTSKIRAYLERSRWRPLNVRLTSSNLARLLRPHIRRVASLRLDLVGQSHMDQVAVHLPEPAPSLRTLSIRSRHVGHNLDIPPSFLGGSFPSLKEILAEDISSFSGPPTFHSVTSFTLHTNSDISLDTASLLRTLERLPALEILFIEFRSRGIPTTAAGDRIVTLQNLRTLSLLSTNDMGGARMGPVLPGLYLPKLEKLDVHSHYTLESIGPCFPLSFSGLLPNFSELPKAVLVPRSWFTEIHLQNESQHTLDIFIGQLSSFEKTREVLGGLPLWSVRSLAIEVRDMDMEWLFGMLGALEGVEDLEIRGRWTQVLRFWRGSWKWKGLCPALRRLVVYGGEGVEVDLAAFNDARQDVGLPLTITHLVSNEGC